GDKPGSRRACSGPQRRRGEGWRSRPLLDAVLPARRPQPRPGVRGRAGKRPGPATSRRLRPHRRLPRGKPPPLRLH
ncbi:MAG: Deoxyribodipyrimidine photolyase, type II, partial [uncultured Rubrobacteraceae bacterium]